MVLKMGHQCRNIREIAMTVVGTTAGVVKAGFRPYYTEVLPVLRHVIVEAGNDQAWLRGKAIECVSMIAVAVGKETFAPDAEAFLRSYAQEALENFAGVLGLDFAPYASVV